MRKFLITTACGALACFGMLGTPAAHAAGGLHGCIDVANTVSLGGTGTDVPPPVSMNVPVTTNAKCTFTFFAGDTYTGVGTFDVTCTLGTGTGAHTVHHTTPNAPMTPLTCNAGALVTVDASMGIVAAGNVM